MPDATIPAPQKSETEPNDETPERERQLIHLLSHYAPDLDVETELGFVIPLDDGSFTYRPAPNDEESGTGSALDEGGVNEQDTQDTPPSDETPQQRAPRPKRSTRRQPATSVNSNTPEAKMAEYERAVANGGRLRNVNGTMTLVNGS